MYSDLNKDEIISQETLQTSGQVKLDNTSDKKKHSRRSSNQRKFVATKGRWYYQTKSRRSDRW